MNRMVIVFVVIVCIMYYIVSGFRWPLSSKAGIPHFMSLNSAQDEKPFKAQSAADGVDSCLKRQSGEIQVCRISLIARDSFV